MLDSAVWRRFSTVIEVKKPTSPEFIEHLLDSVIQEFNFSLESEKKNKDMIIQNFQDLSPSEIRTILISAISNAVIKGENKVQSIAILAEIYRAKNHNKVDKKELIEYLNQNFISQVSLSEWTGLSLRKIKEITSKKESNG
jgi:AAA+ superfamily predicted ATPase